MHGGAGDEGYGLDAAIPGKKIKTTLPDKALPCPLDKANRRFRVPAPNVLRVSDLTYVATWQGFVYMAFVIDAFARRIVGWRVSRTAHAGFVLDALEHAVHQRQPASPPRWAESATPVTNALAETINGLFKTEVIHRRGPWRSFDAVEYATLEWVDWFNNRRLLAPIGNIPPAEAEANHHTALEPHTMAA